MTTTLTPEELAGLSEEQRRSFVYLSQHGGDDAIAIAADLAQLARALHENQRLTQALADATVKAEQYEKDWREAKHEFGVTTGKLRLTYAAQIAELKADLATAHATIATLTAELAGERENGLDLITKLAAPEGVTMTEGAFSKVLQPFLDRIDRLATELATAHAALQALTGPDSATQQTMARLAETTAERDQAERRADEAEADLRKCWLKADGYGDAAVDAEQRADRLAGELAAAQAEIRALHAGHAQRDRAIDAAKRALLDARTPPHCGICGRVRNDSQGCIELFHGGPGE